METAGIESLQRIKGYRLEPNTYNFSLTLSIKATLPMLKVTFCFIVFTKIYETCNLLTIIWRSQDKKHFASSKEKSEWTKEAKQKFHEYLRNMENMRRRNEKNLTQRKLFKAEEILENLIKQKMLFPKKARKRLAMIKENWRYFTAFYHVTDCPATNNALENFYSTSLKTHRKKQLRSDKGIINHMKLSALKRVR